MKIVYALRFRRTRSYYDNGWHDAGTFDSFIEAKAEAKKIRARYSFVEISIKEVY